MKLENALKNFHPKSPTFGNVAGCTSPDRITGTDIMAAMGMTESQAKFGMTAFLAKNDISEEDKFSTVEALTQYALKVAPKLVRKAAGKKLGYCLIILAKMAFEDYARSAGSVCQCSACSGKGMIDKKLPQQSIQRGKLFFRHFPRANPSDIPIQNAMLWKLKGLFVSHAMVKVKSHIVVAAKEEARY